MIIDKLNEPRDICSIKWFLDSDELPVNGFISTIYAFIPRLIERYTTSRTHRDAVIFKTEKKDNILSYKTINFLEGTQSEAKTHSNSL